MILHKQKPKPTSNLTRGPRLIIWLVTAKCNLSCLHCYSSRLPSRQELGCSEAVNLVESAAKAGVKHIGFTGGEAFLRPDAMDLMRLASKLGMTISVVTNGSMLSEDMVKELAKYKVFTILSIDGVTKEIHEKIRGRGSWDFAVAAAEKMRRLGVRFSVVMALNQFNYTHASQYIAWARDLGAATACLIPVMPVGRARKELILQPEQTLQVLKEIEQTVEAIKFPVSLWCTPFAPLVIKSRYVFADSCRTAAEEMDISPDGQVLLCDVLDIAVSNVREKGISEAWEEQKKHPLVRNVANPKLAEPCSDCPEKAKCKGGCFARATIINGDIYSPDPLCPRVAGILEASS